jgi:hypothetical protein
VLFLRDLGQAVLAGLEKRRTLHTNIPT